jgi:hypothetical protein
MVNRQLLDKEPADISPPQKNYTSTEPYPTSSPEERQTKLRSH